MSPHHARVPVPAAAGPDGPSPQALPAAAAPALRPAPAALTVGAADDAAEHAADALADRALARLDDGLRPHRHDPGCGHLRRSLGGTPTGAVGAEGGALGADVTGRIEAARAGGAPLPGAVRRRMEDAFGTGLGHVRVHTGPEAGRLSASMSAEAFTSGDDIFFGSGRYAPADATGEKVLAHEIAHVVQETGSRAVRRLSNPFTKLFSRSSTPAEDEKARTAKESKHTQRAEKQRLADSRVTGTAGRALLQAGVSGEDASTAEAGGRMDLLYAQFDKALAYEVRTYRTLLERTPGLSEQEAAESAYDATWHGRFASLESVRPARETAAERLMVEVRRARNDTSVLGTAIAQEDREVEQSQMLPPEVESVYDRMVAQARTLQEAEPDLHPELVRDRAAKTVRGSLDPKAAARMPARHSPVDREAWVKAEGRAPALAARAARAQADTDANLATLGTVGSVAGPALAGADALGGRIAGAYAPKQQDRRAGGAGTVLPEKVDLGISSAVDAGSRAAARKSSGQKSDDAYDALAGDPLSSRAGQAKEGISATTDVLSSLLAAVREAMATVKAVQKAWRTKDPYEALRASKSGASAVGGLVGAAKSTANLARAIDPGVAAGVATVVPGLDIAMSAIAMSKAVTDVAVAGMRQHETDVAMFEARASSDPTQLDVMVYPLMNVSRTYTKNLENTSWALGSTVADLALSIGQVASGGGFGIPAAIKAAKTVVDGVHGLAHFIIDEVYVDQAQTAERESSVQHLEGGAEAELARHPKAAVDGIVLRAVQGDAVALRFLAGYRLDGEPIGPAHLAKVVSRTATAHDPRRQKPDARPDLSGVSSDDGMLGRIRAAVIGAMGVDADPRTAFERTRAAFDSAVATGDGLRDRWARSGALADRRNQLGAGGEAGGKARTDRGLVWRLRQVLKGEEHLARKERVTGVIAAGGTPQADGGVRVGALVVTADDLTTRGVDEFVGQVTVQEIEAELARRPRRNSPEAVDFLLELLQAKIAADAAQGTP